MLVSMWWEWYFGGGGASSGDGVVEVVVVGQWWWCCSAVVRDYEDRLNECLSRKMRSSYSSFSASQVCRKVS